MNEEKCNQKKSSAKKKSMKGVRNILVVPYDNFWPVISEEDGHILKESLKEVLPLLKKSDIKVPWSELRNLSREERFKKKSLCKNKEIEDNGLRQHLVFGVNAVTRKLEKNNICSILLDSKVDPPLIIKHIVTMAADKKIPILLVPFLSSVTLEDSGFSSVAVAFKNTITESETSAFYKVHKNIVQLFDNISSLKMSPKSLSKENCEIIPLSDDNEMEWEDVKNSFRTSEISVSTDVYLYRNSKTERVFVPRQSKEVKLKTEIMKCKDFLALASGDESDDIELKESFRYHNCYKEVKKKRKKEEKEDCYLPLKVKRVQGNPNRLKATKSKVKKANKKKL